MKKKQMDTIEFINYRMNREKPINPFEGLISCQYPVTFGLYELDCFDEAENYKNISTDRGNFEEINRPDIYGYYPIYSPR